MKMRNLHLKVSIVISCSSCMVKSLRIAYMMLRNRSLFSAFRVSFAASVRSSHTLLDAYSKRVTDGVLKQDPLQRTCCEQLSVLVDSVETYGAQLTAFHRSLDDWSVRRSSLHEDLTARSAARIAELTAAAAAARAAADNAPVTSSPASPSQPSPGRDSTKARPSPASDSPAAAYFESDDSVAESDPYSNRPGAPVVGPRGIYDAGQKGAPSEKPGLGFFATLRSMMPGERSCDAPSEDALIEARNKKMEVAREAERQLESLREKIEEEADSKAGPRPTPPPSPRGLYIHGSVGSGKTLLLNMFFGNLTARMGPRVNAKRVHFNSAMLEVHSLMHKLERQRLQDESRRLERYVAEEESKHPTSLGEGKVGSFMRALLRFERDKSKQHRAAVSAARQRARAVRTKLVQENSADLAKSNASVFREVALALMGLRGKVGHGGGAVSDMPRVPTVLAWDELQVTDPFTAVALKGIFEQLLSLGAVLVFTSNRAPRDLNRHGLHEDLFQHFVARLLETTDEFDLSSERDYRKALADTAAPLTPIPADAPASSLPPPFGRHYLYPVNPATEALLDRTWDAVEGEEEATSIPVAFGRTLEVPRAKGGSARFTFDELCNRTLGVPDYSALALAFHTVFIESIPQLSVSKKDQARRFITCIDELYNNNVRLVVTAPDAPENLFAGTGTDGPILDLESLQFETAVEGGRSRRDLNVQAGVAPLASKPMEAQLGGMEESFAFRRAVSRLFEMQSELFLQGRPRDT